MRDYEKAQSVFERARERDPHRMEHLDAYSNILYVRERRAELSYLAHRSVPVPVPAGVGVGVGAGHY
jgi:anaphase-promoting complex subunit 8